MQPAKNSINPKVTEIPIKEVAKQAKVSVATIRNWIKTKYLVQTSKGMVCAVSLEKFLNEVAGTYKLNNRANKSVKDKHNQNLLAQSISARLKRGEADLDVLGSEYENELSDSFRNKEGIYYTPLDVVEDMLSVDLLPDYSELTFCDPCCGSGNFLMRALELGISPDNIYGFDTDPVAVAIAKQRILEKTGKECKNIQNADFLEYITQTDLQFDLIFTNPPWGKKIDAESKVQLSNYFATGKSNDTSSLFFFAAIKSLKEGGYLGFLLQEAFFNIQIFEDARNKALQYKILKMKDYGKCFDGLITKAQAITLQKCSEEKHDILCEGADYSHFRERESFKQNPKAIFNFFCSAEDSKIIEHIYNQPHITLQNRAEWGMGIVTGNNSKFLQSENQAGYIPVYKGADISEGGLKNASNYIPADLSLYQQVAPIHLYQAKEKLIYKFISSKLSFVCDRKQSFFLNSANMLILNEDAGITHSQLADLLNSKIINFIFQKIFNTHKVLRGDLEQLPIHKDYFLQQTRFTEDSYLRYLQLELKDGKYRKM